MYFYLTKRETITSTMKTPGKYLQSDKVSGVKEKTTFSDSFDEFDEDLDLDGFDDFDDLDTFNLDDEDDF